MKPWRALKLAIRFLHALGAITRANLEEDYRDMLVSLEELYVKTAYPNSVLLDSTRSKVVIIRDHNHTLVLDGPDAMNTAADAWREAVRWVDKHPPE